MGGGAAAIVQRVGWDWRFILQVAHESHEAGKTRRDLLGLHCNLGRGNSLPRGNVCLLCRVEILIPQPAAGINP
jgi:hypothetical protein